MRGALIGGGAEGKKWESRALLIPSGVSWSGKEGNLEFCLPEASFLASQTHEGVRDERYLDQWANLAFLMVEK